jgi:hypothetical protein
MADVQNKMNKINDIKGGTKKFLRNRKEDAEAKTIYGLRGA